MMVGFMAARTHDLVAVEACPVLAPGLARAPAVAQLVANRLGGSNKPLDIQITASRGRARRRYSRPRPGRRQAAAVADRGGRAARSGPAVDAWRDRRRAPPAAAAHGQGPCRARAGRLPAGDARPARRRSARWCWPGCRKVKRVADLFSGCGPIAFRLAERAQVHAVESDKAAVLALTRGERPDARAEADRQRGARPVPPAAAGARAQRLRRRGARSAARRGRGAGAAARGVEGRAPSPMSPAMPAVSPATPRS